MSGVSFESTSRCAWSGALEQMRRNLATAEAVFGAQHAETAFCLSYLGSLLYDLGLFDQAEPCFRRAHTIRAEALGAQHPLTRQSVDDLVGTLAILGDVPSAETMLWQELAIVEEEDGFDHPDLHPILVCLSECLVVRGKVDEAVALLERALAIVRAHEGEGAEDAIATAERIDSIQRAGDVVEEPQC